MHLLSTSDTLGLTLSLCVVFKTLWNLTLAARAFRLRHICKNQIGISFQTTSKCGLSAKIMCFLLSRPPKNQSEYYLGMLKKQFGLSVWPRPVISRQHQNTETFELPVWSQWVQDVGVTCQIRQVDRMLTGSKVKTQGSIDRQLAQIDLGWGATHGRLGRNQVGASSCEKHQVN